MDTVTGRGWYLRKNDHTLKNKPNLIDLTVTRPCGSILFHHAANRSGYAIREVTNVKNSTCRGKFLAISYRLPPLAISTYGEISRTRRGSSERWQRRKSTSVDIQETRGGERLP